MHFRLQTQCRDCQTIDADFGADNFSRRCGRECTQHRRIEGDTIGVRQAAVAFQANLDGWQGQVQVNCIDDQQCVYGRNETIAAGVQVFDVLSSEVHGRSRSARTELIE